MESLLNQRYQWVRALSSNSAGVVLLVEDTAQQRRVVLKVPADPGAGAREFTLLAKLSHPGIVRVYEQGFVAQTSGAFESLSAGASFFTEEWLEGEPLSQLLASPHTAEETALLGISLSRTLSYLHQQHILHGDLSPNNIIKHKEGLILFDLGLSQVSGGTLPYAAPEALCGEASVVSDLFSLGALLFEYWAGRPWMALPSLNPKEALEQVFTALPGPLPDENPALAQSIYRLLEKSPSQRYASAQELSSALSRAIGRTYLAAPQARKEPGRAPLIGREDELSWLGQQALSSLVVVYGEPGIGKSRLLQAFSQWCSDLFYREHQRNVFSWRGDWSALVSSFATSLLSPHLSLDSACGLLLEALFAHIAAGPCVFHIETSPLIAKALDRHLRARHLVAPFTLLLECSEEASVERSLHLRALSKEDANSLAESIKGGPLSSDDTASLLSARGVPGVIESLFVEGGAARPAERQETSAAASEEEARRAFAFHDLSLARRLIERALQQEQTHQRRRQALRAEILLRVGELASAADAALEAKQQPGEDPSLASLCALGATIFTRLGKQAAALQEAQLGLSAAPEVELSSLLRAISARALLSLGELGRAKESVGDIRDEADTHGEARLLEARGLIALHLGEPDALSYFARAKEIFLRLGDPLSVARSLSTIGMSQQASGALREAASSFEEALSLSSHRFDLQAAATYAMNLGAALHAQGKLQAAEEAYQRGFRWLDIFGTTNEKSGAYYNYATLCLDLCDLSVAESNAQHAIQFAKESSNQYVEAYCHLLLGDLAKSRQQVDEARHSYETSCELFRQIQNPRGEAYSLAALCRLSPAKEVLSRLQEIENLAGAQAEVKECQALSLLASQRYEVECRVDGYATGGRQMPPDLAPFSSQLGTLPVDAAALLFGEAAALYQQRGEADRCWRVLSLQSEALQESDPNRALYLRAEAISVVQKLSEQIPPDRRHLFWEDAERRELLGPPRTYQEKKLSRILEISKRLNLESDRERLLASILEAIIELVHAERGFLLTPEGDSFRVSCARHISGDELTPQMPSRSIAEKAAQGDTPVVTIDAESDPRFIEARSVSGLRLRSVLAAPLRAHGKLLGCVYVDDQRRRGAFGAKDVTLVREFGELAAIVLDNAQLQRENLERQTEIERLNQVLSQRVEEQQEELSVAREALLRSGAELRSKYDYSNIIGHSPKMRALFSMVDRVTDSSLPVLLFGESGTGKELIARAIHANGPRAERQLISENCAAIPETLLESALFGHVKGSFTGAERERKGIFELAHKGTLFLDEIGETSPKMLAKLLRALQEGEIRRVGGDRPILVDVRIIAATNRDLKKMVEANLFREDLYFRLAVIRVDLPALRERPEDIPLLVAHFLARAKLAERVKISSRAMARLSTYSWPGNIRELENEITRAALLCDGIIEERHLSVALRREPIVEEAQPAVSPNRLLRSQVEELERRELQQALDDAKGNRSKAAEKLGISRFGLYKKMHRYGLD